MPSSSDGRPPQAPPVVSTRGAPFHLRSPNRALWASPSPPVGLRLGDLRGGPRLAAGPRLGGRTCPRQSQLASQLLNFPSRALRPPLRQHPCLSIRSAHTHPPLARGGRVVCLLCSPSQSTASPASAEEMMNTAANMQKMERQRRRQRHLDGANLRPCSWRRRWRRPWQ